MRRLMVWIAAGFLFAFTAEGISGQEERPDYRIRADFRDGQHQSVGNAEFRIKSRFLQVYYGGVTRKDEYRFGVELSHALYANREFDVSINDYLVGTVAADAAGWVDVNYLSRFHPDDAPDRPLPADFPDPVNVGDLIRIRDHATSDLILSAMFEEEYARGDADLDGKVDKDDYAILVSHYGQPGIGPAEGDFTGDNYSDYADYELMVSHWTDSKSPPMAPQLPGDFDQNHSLDVADLQHLTSLLRSGKDDSAYDVDGDRHLTVNDRLVWVEQLKRTYLGDSNLDRRFDSTDLVEVFQRGEYEDQVPGNSNWSSGDWDGNGDFDSSDFIAAFASGGFEAGARAAVSAVPEPSSWVILSLASLVPFRIKRRQTSSSFK